MANRVQIPTNNSALIAMIADEVRMWRLYAFLNAEQQILLVCDACLLGFPGHI